MSDSVVEGGCQCGAVRYRITGAPVMTALCHCSMCRRANAAPAVAWSMYAQEQVAFISGEPQAYHSSPGAERGFCAHCGTQICFRADYIPGLIDITIGSLDYPATIEPAFHYWDSQRLPWLRFDDGLPRHAEFPPTTWLVNGWLKGQAWVGFFCKYACTASASLPTAFTAALSSSGVTPNFFDQSLTS
jgi:hypothetical protein